MSKESLELEGVLELFEMTDVPDDLTLIKGELKESSNFRKVEIPAHNPLISSTKLHKFDDGSKSELNTSIVKKLIDTGRHINIYGQLSSGIIDSLLEALSSNSDCLFLKTYCASDFIDIELKRIELTDKFIVILNSDYILDLDELLNKYTNNQFILVSNSRIEDNRVVNFHHGFNLGSKDLKKVDIDAFMQVVFQDAPSNVRQEFIEFYLRNMDSHARTFTMYRDSLKYGEKLGLIGHYSHNEVNKDFCIHPEVDKGEGLLQAKIIELSKLCKLPADIKVENDKIKFIDGLSEKEKVIELYEDETLEEFIEYIKKFRRF